MHRTPSFVLAAFSERKTHSTSGRLASRDKTGPNWAGKFGWTNRICITVLLDRHRPVDAVFHRVAIERARERDPTTVGSGRPGLGMEAPSREEEPPRLGPAHGFFLVQDHLSFRTDDAKPDLITGLDAEDVHPEDQGRCSCGKRLL